MNSLRVKVGLMAVLLASPLTARAQDRAAGADDPASGWSWTLSLASDYVFRGATQTQRKPALQPGINYDIGDSGWYAGAWGSNVDYGTGSPKVELDAFVGWSHALDDDWTVDLSLTRYSYLGEASDFGDIDYNELIGQVTWQQRITFTLGYTNDYAHSGLTGTYGALAAVWEVGNGFKLTTEVGRSGFEGDGDYNDWTLSVGRQFGPANIGLAWYDTNQDGERASDSVVLTVGFGN